MGTTGDSGGEVEGVIVVTEGTSVGVGGPVLVTVTAEMAAKNTNTGA